MRFRGWAMIGLSALLALGGVWLRLSNSRPGVALANGSFDWSQQLLPADSLSNSPCVIVYLDLDSFLREKQNPAERWDRRLHARLLHRLIRAGAKVVAFDVVFSDPGPDAAADLEFTDALQASSNVVLAAELSRSSRNTGQSEGVQAVQLSLPAKPFRDQAAAWGVANARMDSDFVVRQIFYGFPELEEPSLPVSIAKLAGAETLTSSHGWIRYYGGPLTIPHVSYSSALRPEEIADTFFRGKIVFIGARPMAGTILERKDEFRNPFAAWGSNELFFPAVEVLATETINLLRHESLTRLPAGTEVCVLAVCGIFLGCWFLKLRPGPGAGMVVAAELGLLTVATLALRGSGIWFPWLIIGAVQIPGAYTGSVIVQSLEWVRQRRRFEERRRADEAKIRQQAALIEKAQDAILVMDATGRFIYANPSATRLYGWTADELGQPGAAERIFGPKIDTLRTAEKQALAAGEWAGDVEQWTRKGTKIVVASHCSRISGENGTGDCLLFINTDVTEKRRIESEFMRAQRMETVGSIAGGMAHDLNNALAPILMGLQLLQKQRQDEETQRMLSVMEANTHRGADMVRQVLLFSRGRDGEQGVLSVGKLLQEMERIVRQTFPKSINVASLTPSDLWPVLGNGTQIHQVLLNLCVNARDAMPNGGTLTLAADNVDLTEAEAQSLPGGRAGRFVMLIVSDTGCGIPAEILPHIFEPFFTTKPQGEGTGLGLSTVARIVSQHGGVLQVKSEPGQGTAFEIYLPVATLPATPADQAPLDTRPEPGNGQLVLVADDDLAVRDMVVLALKDNGYRVLSAANGLEAVAAFQQQAQEIALALIDTDMPGMSGMEVVKHLRQQLPKLPTLLMSGQMLESNAGENLSLLAKPFDLQTLLQAVAERLRTIP